LDNVLVPCELNERVVLNMANVSFSSKLSII
jgi:hypothetical protein